MTDYQWAIETLADCADGVDAANLRELIGELKGDPIYIMEQVARKMEAKLAEKSPCNEMKIPAQSSVKLNLLVENKGKKVTNVYKVNPSN